jgi:hypothetical protein
VKALISASIVKAMDLHQVRKETLIEKMMLVMLTSSLMELRRAVQADNQTISINTNVLEATDRKASEKSSTKCKD